MRFQLPNNNIQEFFITIELEIIYPYKMNYRVIYHYYVKMLIYPFCITLSKNVMKSIYFILKCFFNYIVYFYFEVIQL